MISIAVELPYPPSTGNTMVRHTKTGGHYVNPKFKAWRNEIRAILESGGFLPSEPSKNRCYVDVLARPPDNKARDHTNVTKVLEDALVYAGLIADDSNRIVRRFSFTWADHEPHLDGQLSVIIAFDA